MRDLTSYALEGFEAEPDSKPDYPIGSSAHVAWLVGEWLRSNGGIRPKTVTSESGYAVRVDGVKVEVPAGATGTPRIASD